MINRIWLKIFSVILAIFSWMYVNLVDPPQIRRNIQLPIEYINVPQSLRISPPKANATARLEGNRRDFMYAKSSNRYAQLRIDLKNLKAGSFQLPVEIANIFPGLSSISISREMLLIEAEKVVTKNFLVTSEIIGQAEEGYLADQPIITPYEVSLQGPEELLNKVSSCYVEINYERIRNSLSQNLDVKLKFTDPTDESRIIIEPTKVSIDVAVKQGFPKKSVKISKATFRGKLPEGKKIESYQVIPLEVFISGPSRIINPITEISFRPINLSTLTESALIPVAIELPNNKISLIATQAVWLDVVLTDIPVKRIITAIPIEISSSQNETVSVSVASYTLTVEGKTEDLNRIIESDLKTTLIIPNEGVKVMEIKLDPPSTLPPNITIISIEPAFVSVNSEEIKSNE